jgi:hypothetical protein
MAELTTLVCNICGKQRASDTNHWRKVFLVKGAAVNDPGGIYFTDVTTVAMTFGVEVKELPDPDAHVCGDACAVTAFSQWLSTGAIECGKAGEKSNA